MSENNGLKLPFLEPKISLQIASNVVPVKVKPAKQRLSRAITSTQFLQMRFTTLPFTGVFLESFGLPEDNFSMIIYGESGNGKTEGEIQLCKYMSQFGHVYFNSKEQGFSLSLQQAWIRNKMDEVADKVKLVHKESYENMVRRLKRKQSAKIVFIDSIQHSKITYDMWISLRAMFPKKIFILISHSEGRRPQGAAAKAIEYDVDLKVFVKDFVMYNSGRFGGGKPYIIYEDGYRRKVAQKKGKRPNQIKLPI